MAAAEPSAPPKRARTYRAQMGLTDGAALGVGYLVNGLVRTPSNSPWSLLPVGLTFVTFAPAMHLTHHNTSSAIESFGLRVALPAAGAAIAWAKWHCVDGPQRDCYDGNNDTTYALLGAFAGGVVAAVIDDVVLAREPGPDPVAWAPLVAPTVGGVSFGLARTW
jgi:hypothetical protein